MTNVEKLNEKIDELIKMYQELKRDNDSLRNQLVASQAQNETLVNKTKNFENDLSDKDVEIDTILEKINNITN